MLLLLDSGQLLLRRNNPLIECADFYAQLRLGFLPRREMRLYLP
ncbi:hypothetical protein GGI1_07592 [Acidithiobacillus sp. GGI-221]|nr:hypothetical protein GGI1_07592 [Acidithiobacillus sp. GGI-221]